MNLYKVATLSGTGWVIMPSHILLKGIINMWYKTIIKHLSNYPLHAILWTWAHSHTCIATTLDVFNTLAPEQLLPGRNFIPWSISVPKINQNSYLWTMQHSSGSHRPHISCPNCGVKKWIISLYKDWASKQRYSPVTDWCRMVLILIHMRPKSKPHGSQIILCTNIRPW